MIRRHPLEIRTIWWITHRLKVSFSRAGEQLFTLISERSEEQANFGQKHEDPDFYLMCEGLFAPEVVRAAPIQCFGH